MTCHFLGQFIVVKLVQMFLALKKEQKFQVFQNKMLRKLFGYKRVEVNGLWRMLYAELHIFIPLLVLLRVK